ncbi:uncharacterized protein LOC110039550 isoform X2 [Phalaenopsis equestris]|uniref:uncharacterized protein LOC110039550 isoform X2 n=1 Tax=Phalaenopsis equestris TaxID=78828 RepID=UPI0009E5EE63|nr:uncharacterized protein LOC110039550 isoform X2 [Phalaenopsis equestris]
MVMYEHDPDVLRWGFDFLNGDPFSTSSYCGVTTESDANFYDGTYSRESNFVTDHTSLGSDEIMAHALQEEFSRLAVAEATSPANVGEHLQASALAQNWFGPTMNTYTSDGEESSEDTDPSSACCSPGEISLDGDEWLLELTEDCSTIDGELGKRLNLLIPIPHVPRINGEIPSVDEATSDHQRLLDRLQLYDLVELKVQGDGNCQFRALSDQFYRTPEHHKFVRQQIINELKSNPEIYEGYVPMAYDDYLKKLSKNGEWGDHVTLQAAADSYGVKIFVITSFRDTCYIEILPNDQRSKRVIFLSFWAEVHYNSIYPAGDLPTAEVKKKKRWWHFGNKH